MPPLRQIHRIYPFDDDSGIALGAPGIWFELSTAPGFVGLPESDWPTPPTTGSPESRRATFEAELNAALQTTCELRKSFADMKADDVDSVDPVIWDMAAEPFCRYETFGLLQILGLEGIDLIDEYVVRVVEIFVPVVSINPVVIGSIVVSNAASGISYA